mmetsp:Transcript_61562/g.74039  ORF Transcript_61562/g.74039 Transcript_61562/m.74039 type:complete len:218 (-) Transcript_61562:14-667(-)
MISKEESSNTSDSTSFSYMDMTTKCFEFIERNSTPRNILLMGSVPLVAGSYSGYLRALSGKNAAVGARMNQMSSFSSFSIWNDWFQDTEKETVRKKKNKLIQPAKKVVQSAKSVGVSPALIAFRALSLGSLVCLGGSGLLFSAIFHFSGFNSVADLIDSCKVWAPQKRRSLEDALDFKLTPDEKYKHDPDVVATKGMAEDDELNYFKEKYLNNDQSV